MKIAILHPQFQSGGLDRVVLRLCRGFAGSGHDVELLTANISGSMHNEIPGNVRRVQLPVPVKFPAIKGLVSPGSWTSLLTVPAVARYMRKSRPDVMLAASSLNGAVLGTALSRTRIPLVLRVSIHQSASSEGDSHISARALPHLRRRLFKRAQAVVTNSNATAEDLLQTLGLQQASVNVINNPSADPEIQVRAQEEVSHPWFIDRSLPVAVTAGRLAPQKDIPTLLRALAIIKDQAPCRLVVLGDGAEREKLERLSHELSLDDLVSFKGFVANPWAYIVRSDLFMFSSHWEGSPNSVIEAMSLGTPVVATDCPGGPRELMKDGELGHLVPVGDADSMAKAWIDVLKNREAALDRARQGISHMRRYDFDTVIGEYLKLFDRVLSARSRA